MKNSLFKKSLSLFLAILMVSSVGILTVSAAGTGTTDYTIINPYESVDWSTWQTYKANLHTHSTASDGDVDLPDMVKLYYDAGYEILAMTDHGVINYGWNKDRQTNGVFNFFRDVSTMSDADYEMLTTGSERNGRGITDVTGGIEINMAVISKTHVNGYFTTYGQAVWGKENDYATAPAEIERLGGYSVLNHVGDWVDSNNYPEKTLSTKYISYFANIFKDYHTCLGMEISNNTDNVTKYDKVLWDELLEVVIPTGRNIWAFSDDDSEQSYEVGRSFELFVLPENNEENVKTAMADGTFFAASKYAKNDIADDFEGTGNVPRVKEIIVNQEENTIEVIPDENYDCSAIEWVCGVDTDNIKSKVIATGSKIDLNDYEDELTCYIRFQMKGEGGATYSQAFELQYDGRTDKDIPVYEESALEKFTGLFSSSHFYALFMLIIDKILLKFHS